MRTPAEFEKGLPVDIRDPFRGLILNIHKSYYEMSRDFVPSTSYDYSSDLMQLSEMARHISLAFSSVFERVEKPPESVRHWENIFSRIEDRLAKDLYNVDKWSQQLIRLDVVQTVFAFLNSYGAGLDGFHVNNDISKSIRYYNMISSGETVLERELAKEHQRVIDLYKSATIEHFYLLSFGANRERVVWNPELQELAKRHYVVSKKVEWIVYHSRIVGFIRKMIKQFELFIRIRNKLNRGGMVHGSVR